eukprot:jgi/Undpi1/12887/HiC_scaffold_7.g02553.m1
MSPFLDAEDDQQQTARPEGQHEPTGGRPIISRHISGGARRGKRYATLDLRCHGTLDAMGHPPGVAMTPIGSDQIGVHHGGGVTRHLLDAHGIQSTVAAAGTKRSPGTRENSSPDYWPAHGKVLRLALQAVAQAVFGCPASAWETERDFCIADMVMPRQHGSLESGALGNVSIFKSAVQVLDIVGEEENDDHESEDDDEWVLPDTTSRGQGGGAAAGNGGESSRRVGGEAAGAGGGQGATHVHSSS